MSVNASRYPSSGAVCSCSSGYSPSGPSAAPPAPQPTSTSCSAFDLIITRFAGGSADRMKYGYAGDVTPEEHHRQDGTVYGHANAAGAESVGAADYLETPAFGRAPAALEPFSSAGGAAILFDRDGRSLVTPVLRRKPGVVAPDGVNTTFFFADREDDEDGFPNFFVPRRRPLRRGRSRARRGNAGEIATITGSAAGEVIIGTAGRDVTVAEGGNDEVHGRGRNDLLCGGGKDFDVRRGRPGSIVRRGRQRPARWRQGPKPTDRQIGTRYLRPTPGTEDLPLECFIADLPVRVNDQAFIHGGVTLGWADAVKLTCPW